MEIEKIWLKSYPKDVPATINSHKYASLNQLFDESFKRNASKNAFYCMGKFLKYKELDHYSNYLAAWLQSQNLTKGARVAVMLPNLLQYPIATTGILRAGYTVVNVNPLYTARELEHQLKDSGAEVIIVLENFASVLEKVVANTGIKHIVIATMGDMHGCIKGCIINFVVRRIKKMVPTYDLPNAIRFKKVLSEGGNLLRHKVEKNHNDIAFLQYTGGTTGPSKGAVLLHGNIIANMLQNNAWVEATFKKELQSDEQLVTVCALPLYHIMALNACMLMGIHWGALNILIPNPRDINGLVKELAKFRYHFFLGVNTLFNALLQNEKFRNLDFSGLCITLGGGMAVQKTVSDEWKKVTGNIILQGYGLSETSPTATLSSPEDTEFTETIGLAVPSTDIAILNENEESVALGEIGEIAIRGPQVMAGYWNQLAETAKVMTKEGFFKSGDLGTMDSNGYIRIVDRKKDMILVSGFNVYPTEIEEVIASHPDVLECACIGVPDKYSGEAVKVFVVRKNSYLTSEQVFAHCKNQLTAYKRPKYIEFREELPKTNVGKILRRELRGK